MSMHPGTAARLTGLLRRLRRAGLAVFAGVATVATVAGMAGTAGLAGGGGGAGAATAGTPSWLAIGPYAGAGALASSAADPAVIYASDEGAGLFKSTDGGGTWTLLAPPTTTALATYAVAVDPHNPDTVFIATSAGVYRSHDGGASWMAPVQAPDSRAVTGPALAVDPTDAAVVYVGTYLQGVYRSTDGGASWRPANAGMESSFISSLALAAAPGQTPATLYAGVVSGGAVWGVYRSADGGGSWVASNQGLPSLTGAGVAEFRLAVDRGTPSRLYVASPAYPTTIYTSGDGAGSWTPTGPGGFPLATGAPGVVYTSTARTFDGGATWTATPNPLALEVKSILADPLTPGIALKTDGQGLVRTADGGASWQSANQGLATAQVGAIAADPASSRVIYASTYQALWKSGQGGTLWHQLPLPLSPGDVIAALLIDPLDPATVYVGSNSDGLLASGDGGRSWQARGNLVAISSLALGTAPPERLYAHGVQAGSSCNAFLSTDGGSAWSCLASLDTATVFFPDPFRAATLYAFDDHLFKSLDGGIHWHRADRNGLGNALYQSAANVLLDASRPSRLYTARGDQLYRSDDGAGHWVRVLPGPPAGDLLGPLVQDPSAPATLYATFITGATTTARSGTLRSLDGGAHWSELPPGPPGAEVVLATLRPDGGTTLYESGGLGVFRLDL